METVETINKRLAERFGKFETDEPNFRVVWSDDQLEKRFCEFDEHGMKLLHREVREVPRYNYIEHKYILEKILPVPQILDQELVEKLSYEPIWTFQDRFGNALPPDWDIIDILVNVVFSNIGTVQSRVAKYLQTSDDVRAEKEKKIQEIHETLFGNDSKITDALGLDTAVGYGVRQRKDWLQ